MSTTIESPIEVQKSRLWTDLEELKQQCKSTLKQITKGRMDEYRNFAKILLWTISAKAIDGFYEALIAFGGASRTRTDTHAHNYAPLLTILFENLLSTQDKNKISRALNVLEREYTSNSDMYQTDAVNKLANFIVKQGGFVKLIRSTYKNSDLKNAGDFDLIEECDVDSIEQRFAEEAANVEMTDVGHGISLTSVKPKLLKSALQMLDIKDEVIKDKLLEDALSFMNVKSLNRQAKFESPLNHTEEGYSIALVKKNGKSISYINSFNDDVAISNGIFGSYRADLNATPASIRILSESVRTQALPPKLKLVARDLYEVVRKKTEHEPALLARPRLLHRADTNEFVLSPMHVKTAVVTTVTPFSQLLDRKDYDVVLSTPSMMLVDRLLVMKEGTNFFKPETSGHIRALPNDDVYSHSLALTHKADKSKTTHVTFQGHQHDQEVIGQPVAMHGFDVASQNAINLSATVAAALSIQYADQWLAEIDKHITRPANQVMQLVITGTHIKFRYFDDGADYKGQYSIVYDEKGDSSITHFKGEFLTKDLMPVLGCLGHLPLTGDVGIKAIDNALFLTFTTTIAKICIAVPSFIREEKKRSANAFSFYTPTKKQLTKEQLWEQSVSEISDSDFSWEFNINQFNDVTYGEVENV